LTDQIEPPVDESGLKLISFEKEEMDKAAEANDKQEDVGKTQALASIFHIIPDINIDATPWGVGVATTVLHGLGNAAEAVARANQVVVGNRTFSSTNAGRKAGFLRQMQDRVLQANIAGYEIKNIDKQILTQNIRINIANQEITDQQKQIDNAKEVEDFLRRKYTNQELYAWMESQVRTLYYQAYTLAYDLAKKAEKVFRFERGLQESNFIQYGYWDPAYDGPRANRCAQPAGLGAMSRNTAPMGSAATASRIFPAIADGASTRLTHAPDRRANQQSSPARPPRAATPRRCPPRRALRR